MQFMSVVHAKLSHCGALLFFLPLRHVSHCDPSQLVWTNNIFVPTYKLFSWTSDPKYAEPRDRAPFSGPVLRTAQLQLASEWNTIQWPVQQAHQHGSSATAGWPLSQVKQMFK